MPFPPPPGQLGDELPSTAGEEPSIRAEALKEERETATTVRGLLDQEFALATVVCEPLGV
jgi:hypothetical protein